MTAAEQRICDECARRFPSSAAARGGSPLRIRVETAFADLLAAGPDSRESFLEAAEHLASANVISLSWKRFREGDELSSIQLIAPEKLFSAMGKPFPADEAQKARTAARSCAEAAESPSCAHSLFAWFSENITAEDVPVGAKDGTLTALVQDLFALACELMRVTENGTLKGITPRALSVRLFSNSKRIEAILAESAPLLRRAERSIAQVPDFSPVGRNYPETLLAGPFTLNLKDRTVIDNQGGHIVGIPLTTADILNTIVSSTRKLLTVENKETFHALASSPVARNVVLMYSGGHPNKAVQSLLRSFTRSGFTLSHAGDLDIEGILILQEIADCAGQTCIPVKMDGRVFQQYREHLRNLDDNALKRAALIRDDTRALAGIESLLERILATGKGLEQEVIDYGRT